MTEFLEMLNNNDKVVINVTICTKDAGIICSELKFNIVNYYYDNNCIRLITDNDAELFIGTDCVIHDKDEYDEDVWVFEINGSKVFINIEEIN